ncbi:MAG: hypothetical protein AMJ59_22165 [Gammaproteobacteria bacterium SG8_31]|nr:MAG: hypothetical protein AMJ59_22165 [Gammaproteobacteria bacterium SG8_31]
MTDRVAVVTGTSSGIGAALARRLLDEGWAVAGLSRREVALEHGGYQHMVLDLGNLHALQTLAEKRLGALMRDPRWARVALVNNAALGGSHKGIEDTDPEELAWLLAVNTVAPVYLMGFAARTVPPQTALRIVNVSSGRAGRLLREQGSPASGRDGAGGGTAVRGAAGRGEGGCGGS